jgi:N-acetylmuramoyl-L-alanine amidase
MIYDADDIHNLALVAWKEARGEGIAGCVAVMHVVINRVGKPGFARTLHDVIYGKNQFSSMSIPSDAEFNLQPDNGAIWQGCMTAAPNVLSGANPDPTLGALYYANLEYTTSGWFFNQIANNPSQHPETVKIGHHTFFK